MQAHTPPAPTITERTPPAKRTLPATSKERPVCTRDPRSGGAAGTMHRGLGHVGPHAHVNAARQVVDDQRTEVRGQQKQSNDPRNNHQKRGTPITGHRQRTNGTRRNQHSPGTPTTGHRERGNDTSRSTVCSDRQNTTTGRSMRREGRVAVQGPRKEAAARQNVTQGAGFAAMV